MAEETRFKVEFTNRIHCIDYVHAKSPEEAAEIVRLNNWDEPPAEQEIGSLLSVDSVAEVDDAH